MNDVAVQFVVSGAGTALLVAAISGVRAITSERAPRRRVEAIRAAQECLTLIGSDHAAMQAIAEHQRQEADALAALVRRKALAPRRWAAVGLLTGVLAVAAVLLVGGLSLLAAASPADATRTTLSGGLVGAALAFLGLFVRFLYRLVRNWQDMEPSASGGQEDLAARPLSTDGE